MNKQSTKMEMVDATAIANKDVYVKVFFNKEKTKYCAQLLTGKYVICDLNDPESCLDTTIFDQKPAEFTDFDFITLEHLQYSEFKWLFYAILILPDHESTHKLEQLLNDHEVDGLELAFCAADGWQIVFPVSSNRLYLHNPPMFYITEDALSVS